MSIGFRCIHAASAHLCCIEADQSVSQTYSGEVIGSGRVTSFDHGVLAAGVDSDGPFIGDEYSCVVKC